MGCTIAYLHLSGNIPVNNELLNMRVRGLLIDFTQCFRILLDIPSYHVEFLDLRDIIVIFISASVTGIISICVILSNLVFRNNFKALFASPFSVPNFAAICV